MIRSAKMSNTSSNGMWLLRILVQIEKIDLVRLLIWYSYPILSSFGIIGSRNRAINC